MNYYQKIDNYLKQCQNGSASISEPRKEELKALAQSIMDLKSTSPEANVVFICTHNSRRSQIAELFFRLSIRYFGLKGVHGYSGGTEATAFYPSAVKACRDKGVAMIQKSGSIVNHTYLTVYKFHLDVIRQFSKKYNDPHNPSKNFVAVMVCDSANESCPLIPDCFARIPLLYVDPKFSDQTDKEEETYALKVDEIAIEMNYLCSLLQ